MAAAVFPHGPGHLSGAVVPPRPRAVGPGGQNKPTRPGRPEESPLSVGRRPESDRLPAPVETRHPGLDPPRGMDIGVRIGLSLGERGEKTGNKEKEQEKKLPEG